MAESYLKEVFTKTNANKEVKGMINSMLDKVLSKTIVYVKEKYLDQTLKRKKTKKKNENELSSSFSARFVPVSKIREENYMDFKQKEEETKDFIKKLKKEQKERERRQKEREEEEKKKLLEEQRAIEKQKKEMILIQEQEKLKRVSELKDKSKKRKHEIQELIELGNQEYKKVLSSKPLHEKIEEKYFSKVLMPELERHKIELAKKREMLQPINRSAILEHAKKHDQVIEEHEQQRRNGSQETNYDAARLRSKYTIAYIEDLKKRKQEIEKESLDKKSLIEKKKQYAELVLEIHQPTVDPAKKLELEIIKENLKNSSVKMIKKRSAKSLSAQDGLSDGEKKKLTRKILKKNPMVPEPKKKEPPKIVDWLQEQRKNRGNQDSKPVYDDYKWDGSLSEEKIKSKVKVLEKEIRKNELQLEISNPTNLRGIEKTEQVSDMLINTIKGKLAILGKS
jgi:hypothetical protein